MIVEAIDSHHVSILVESESETDGLGRALARVVQPGTVIGLVGTLGAGKTRLVRALASELGVDPGMIASPTFVLIHEYPGRFPISHFDAYRLANPDAFEALGASDYWADGDGLCLVEWGDLVADRLPGGSWWIRIELLGETGRRFTIDSPEAERLASILRESGASAG
jgi:tRNA threonylcarbamoyladenosine biosynthesis protein TsaE